MSNEFLLHLKKDELLFKAGDEGTNLYILQAGKLLICVRKGTQVTGVAYISSGDYIGELSFFDDESRSADVIALEDCTLIKVAKGQLEQKFPNWLATIARFQTSKLRKMDKVIQKKGIKKKNIDTIKPLSIEEQRYYLDIINKA
jgi:CRP/FNR family transcriptional regulator, cyclic AMP receptor protein